MPTKARLEGQSRARITTRALVFLLAWVTSTGYMATQLKRNWVPHDEGTLGLSAERALNGQLPHRDFDDYTGGLTFVHALAFKAFGINSVSMRIVLFVFFIPWVPAVFFIASRLGSLYSAGAITLLAVVWSVPNYPGPMPSWYNMFFATAGAAALIRYIEVGTRRWLVLGGLCGGLSFLAKISAAYFIAGALLFFVFREQSIAQAKNRESAERARFYSATLALGLATFLALLFSVIHKVPGIAGLIYFVLPACVIVVFLLAREIAGVAGSDADRFTALMGMCGPFAAGIVIPLILFVIPYIISGAVHDLIHGLLAAPVRAIRIAMHEPENPLLMISIIPFMLPVLAASGAGKLGRFLSGGIFSVCAVVVLFYSVGSAIVFEFGWCSLATAIPALTLTGAAVLWGSPGKRKLSPIRQQQIMLLISVAALCSLVQYPYSSRGYFCYVAPLVILGAAAILASMPRPPRFVLASLIIFYVLFAIVSVTPYRLGVRVHPGSETERLTLARAGGLRVEPSDADVYERLIPLVQAHAKGDSIYAGPDCPEVYFLSGLKIPMRHYFDLADDQAGYADRILHMLESFNVNVVAIKKTPRFSGPLSPELQTALELRYPHSANLEFFQVRWKE